MKRIILLITFIVGLMPNLKDMCLECVYCVMGQSMFDENFWDEVPEGSCEDLGGIWCEICSTCHAETNTNPSCQTKCEQCGISYLIGSTHYHNDNSNDNNDNNNEGDNEDNNEDNNEGNNEGNSGTNIEINNYKILCLNCNNSSILYTYSEWKRHSATTKHYLYRIIIP